MNRETAEKASKILHELAQLKKNFDISIELEQSNRENLPLHCFDELDENELRENLLSFYHSQRDRLKRKMERLMRELESL